MQNLRHKLTLSLIFALVVFLGLTFYADAPRLANVLATFNWTFLPIALAATLVNYGLRFLRWHYYLAVISVRGVAWQDSLLIFLSGFSLTLTPGKLGEVLKSLFLKNRYQTPMSYSAPIVVAERLTDVFGMVLLAAVGFLFYPFGIGILVFVLAATTGFIVLVQQRSLAERLMNRATLIPALARFANLARNMFESTYLLLRLQPLIFSTILATAAWFGECVAFFFVLMGTGLTPTFQLFLQAMFIYAAASLFGALAMLPGGLGATEGGITLLLQQLVGLTRDVAVGAALIVRLCTLWFAILLGAIALLILGMPVTQPAVNAINPNK